MRAQAQPTFNVYIRLDCETEAIRRDLQEKTGLSGSRLVSVALREYAHALDIRREAPDAGVPARSPKAAG
jgi:hypothetical protein